VFYIILKPKYLQSLKTGRRLGWKALLELFCITKAIAHSQIDPAVHQEHVLLLEKNQAGSLTVEEREKLMAFQGDCDRLMLRKAYAWSMLRWRGYPIPAIKDLAIVG
jgi:hypothetical protein